MHEHTTIPLPHQELLTEAPLPEVVRQEAGRALDVERNCDRAMYHIVSRVQSGGGAAYLFLWTSASTVYKLLEIERLVQYST